MGVADLAVCAKLKNCAGDLALQSLQCFGLATECIQPASEDALCSSGPLWRGHPWNLHCLGWAKVEGRSALHAVVIALLSLVRNHQVFGCRRTLRVCIMNIHVFLINPAFSRLILLDARQMQHAHRWENLLSRGVCHHDIPHQALTEFICRLSSPAVGPGKGGRGRTASDSLL